MASRILSLMATEMQIECPRCHSTDVTRRVALEDKRNAYIELDITCPKCSRTWRMLFDRGRHIRTDGPWPSSTYEPFNTKEIGHCPICDKYVDEDPIRRKTYCLGHEFAVAYLVHKACYAKLPGDDSEKTKLLEAALLKMYASPNA